MKRGLFIAAFVLCITAAAVAREYTNLDPPTLAVMDFEVSMSPETINIQGQVVREDTKAYYGQLFSQALLTVLVQQNASNVLVTPRGISIDRNSTLYDPGTPVYNPGMRDDVKTMLAQVQAQIEKEGQASQLQAQADAAEKNATDLDNLAQYKKQLADKSGADKDRKDAEAAKKDAEKARTDAIEARRKANEYWPVGSLQVQRYYYPPIFKIYDKKYVENALQNGSFTTKDLYTKAVNAFAFADLDFLVLGNVYETKYSEAGAKTETPAIGFNVRVLNTKRAEELYSYSAVIRSDLSDLPLACSVISERIMMDILNSHCAQFCIKKSKELTKKDPTTGAEPVLPDYTLFWQPRQVEKDDNTVGDSDHSNKRKVEEDQFYWVLPGTYVISLYNKVTQKIREIPFTIAAGAVMTIPLEKPYFDRQTGPIIIGGVAPTSSYHFKIVPQNQTEQYWWEIFTSVSTPQTVELTFTNGEFTEGDLKNLSYNPDTQEILITNIDLGSYTIQATRNPVSKANGIDGLLQVVSNESVQSAFIPVVVPDSKGARMKIADFNLQDKKAIESPRLTKISFIMDSGFYKSGALEINDGLTDNWIYWSDKEKITVSTEYSQADYDAQPEVTYKIWVLGEVYDAYGIRYAYYVTNGDNSHTYSKKQLVPSRDTLEFVDADGLKVYADSMAKWEMYWETGQSPVTTTTAAATTTAKPTAAKTAAAAAPHPAAAGGVLGTMLDVFGGIGYGSYSSYDSTTSTTTTGTGMAVNLGTAVSWSLAPSFGLGAGLDMDWITSTSPDIMATLALNTGDPSKGSMLFLADLGIGTGVMVDLGGAFLNAQRTGGFTARLGFVSSFLTSGFALFIDGGYMFGF